MHARMQHLAEGRKWVNRECDKRMCTVYLSAAAEQHDRNSVSRGGTLTTTYIVQSCFLFCDKGTTVTYTVSSCRGGTSL